MTDSQDGDTALSRAVPAAVTDLERLRRRLAALGEVQGSPRERPQSRSGDPEVGDLGQRLASVGFAPAGGTGRGAVGIRRVRIDLGPFLERAGVPHPDLAGDVEFLVDPRRAHEMEEHGSSESSADRRSAPRVAVLDLETVGLRGSGVLPFLVGVGIVDGRSLEVDQFLLADPAEEGALLDAVAVRLQATDVLLTYNGRGFDLAVLRARCIVNRRSPAPFECRRHCDLLGIVRRLFRDRLGSCSLARAEVGLLGLERGGDITGAEVPALYLEWLRGCGRPATLAAVVRHNQLDLCATAVLGARVAAHLRGDLLQPGHPADRYRLAVHLERHGLADGIADHYRAAITSGVQPWRRRAAARLARHHRRHGRLPDACGLWLDAWRDSCSAGEPDLRVARSLVWGLSRLGRREVALAICAEAAEWCRQLVASGRHLPPGAPRQGWLAYWDERRWALEASDSAGRRRRWRSGHAQAGVVVAVEGDLPIGLAVTGVRGA